MAEPRDFKAIVDDLLLLGERDYDPRHIEAVMRDIWGPGVAMVQSCSVYLGTVSREVDHCISHIDRIGKESAEALAQSYGL